MRFGWFIGILILLRVFLFLYFVISKGQYYSPDSGLYIDLATNMVKFGVFSLSPGAPFVPEIFRTPGYPAFLALLEILGMESPYWAVFWQELIYAGCILMFYQYGRTIFGNKITRIGVIFLLLEPGGLTYPKLLLSETLFLPFFMGGVLAIGLYLRDLNWRYLAAAGILMGLGAIIRPAILYLPLVIALTLAVFDWKDSKRWLHGGILVLSFVLIISPWLIRNQYHFGKMMMTGQQSNMFSNYHVPLVWESVKGIPFDEGRELSREQVRNAVAKQEKLLGRSLSRVEVFNLQQKIALHELAKHPLIYAMHWTFGMLKTINGVNLTEFYHAFRLRIDRLHFFQVESTNFAEKVYIFLKHQDVIVLLAVLVRVVIAVFALLGALQIIKKRDCFLWIMMLANFYFICVPGPMGYSRFRFPVEVFWFIQAYYGLTWVVNHFQLRGKAAS
jgi:4-amino-4-deoxy-L-arabinose transferase-like glycosyltransferase